MICECCNEQVGARRPYKRDLAGTYPAKMVCLTCFDELMEVAKAIRDTSGVIAWAVVGDEEIPPIRIFDGTEELRLTIVDVEEQE
jgi:hypothetical protein